MNNVRALLAPGKRNEWETPQGLFDALNDEFGFDLDVCALPENAKCAKFYTPHDDGLSKPWAGVVWCNPPYGSAIGKWVEKAAREHAKENNYIVMLLPARTDTKWFHDYLYGKTEIRFIRGRLRFGEATHAAPFPSMLCIFAPRTKTPEEE